MRKGLLQVKAVFALSLLGVLAACASAGAPRPKVSPTSYEYGSAFETTPPATTAGAGDAGTVDQQPQVVVLPASPRPRTTPSAEQYDSPKPFPARPYLSVQMAKPQLPYSSDPQRDQPYVQTLNVLTEVNAHVDVVVTYSDGNTTYGGTASGLASGGEFQDSWHIDKNTPKGTVRVTVTAVGSQHATWNGTFEVTDSPPRLST